MSYRDRLIKLDLFPLSMRREVADLQFLFKTMMMKAFRVTNNNHFQFYSNDFYKTRGHDSLQLMAKYCRTEQFKRSYFNRVTASWNVLPYFIRSSESCSSFHSRLVSFYKSNVLPKYDPDNACSWFVACMCANCRNTRSLIS